MFGELGVDGVYLDQTAAHGPHPCMDKTHSHKPGGGSWWSENQRELLAELNAIKPADKIFTSEGTAEVYANSLDGLLSWAWIVVDKYVPAFMRIYGGKVDASGLMSKIGLKAETVKTHEYADATTFTRPWTDREKAALQEYMDEFYERFTGVVSKATGIPQATVDTAYGGGRVMIGVKAYAAGLVHGLGGIDDAVAVAKQLAGLSADTDIELKVLGSGHSMMLPVPGSKMFADFSEWSDYIYDLSRPQLWAVEPYLFEPSLLGIE